MSGMLSYYRKRVFDESAQEGRPVFCKGGELDLHRAKCVAESRRREPSDYAGRFVYLLKKRTLSRRFQLSQAAATRLASGAGNQTRRQAHGQD